MPTFGNENIEANTKFDGVDEFSGSKFSLTEAGTMTQISIFTANGGKHIKCAVYRVSDGKLMAYSDSVVTAASAWTDCALTSLATCEIGDYYLCWNSNEGGIGIKYDGSWSGFWGSKTFAAAFPDPLVTGGGTDTLIYSIHADYSVAVPSVGVEGGGGSLFFPDYIMGQISEAVAKKAAFAVFDMILAFVFDQDS